MLGYPNEYGLLTERPTLPPAADPHGMLPRDVGGRPDLGRNGSYLVLRTLRQDASTRTTRSTDTSSRDAAGQSDPRAARPLAAKIVGRWPSGAALVLGPRAGLTRRSRIATISAITQSTPRPGLPARLASADQPARDSRAGTGDRRVRWPSTAGTASSAAAAASGRRRPVRSAECSFICLSANLARQYEFVQHTWVNNPGLQRARRTKLTRWSGGAAPNAKPLHHARSSGAPSLQRELPQFVHVRGGAYFFLPSASERCDFRPAPTAEPTPPEPPDEEVDSTCRTAADRVSPGLPQHAVLACCRCGRRSHRSQDRVGPAAEGAQPRRAHRPARHPAPVQPARHQRGAVHQPAAAPAGVSAAADRADVGRHPQRSRRPRTPSAGTRFGRNIRSARSCRTPARTSCGPARGRSAAR